MEDANWLWGNLQLGDLFTVEKLAIDTCWLILLKVYSLYPWLIQWNKWGWSFDQLTTGVNYLLTMCGMNHQMYSKAPSGQGSKFAKNMTFCGSWVAGFQTNPLFGNSENYLSLGMQIDSRCSNPSFSFEMLSKALAQVTSCDVWIHPCSCYAWLCSAKLYSPSPYLDLSERDATW